ncbi:MAG: hypothetical protein HN405_08610 [Planctomycetes bacterium]|jgi:hypothetical protein|nr:hypothetical protein [Planctomycetota bacterium]MBT4029688.1 hypothetical protein [Planctomycetota bacterium]MBT4561188.1 hypothetical protein [Planctomycetota bacterium]MBT7319552.1 hypothetical protein [Planctomycetota bacterium]
MSPKRFFIFVLILAALAVAVSMFLPGDSDLYLPGSDALNQSVVPDTFCPLPPDSIQSYWIKQPAFADALLLRRESQSDDFSIIEPHQDFLQPSAYASLLAAFEHSIWQKPPSTWTNMSDADLGLDPPKAHCVLTTFEGDEWVFKIGAEDRGAAWRAATRNGERIRFSTSFYARLMAPPYLWRDYAVLRDAAQYTQISWHPLQGQPWRLIHRLDGWRFSEPFDAPLNQHGLSALARLLGARARGFEQDILYQEQLPLVEGSSWLEFSNGQEELRLSFCPKGLVVSNRPYLMEAEASDFALLSKTPDELRSNLLLELDKEWIESVSFTLDGETTRFSKSRRGWLPESKIAFTPNQLAYLDSLLLAFLGLERGTVFPIPSRAPDGSCALTTAMGSPNERVTRIQWWRDDSGKNLFCVNESTSAFLTTLNFAHATRDFVRGFSDNH